MDMSPRSYPQYSDDRYFYTKSVYLAAYLSLKGLSLVNVETTSRIAVYTFRDASDREYWVQTFDQGRAVVNARQYAIMHRDLKRLTMQAGCKRCSAIKL